MITPMHTWSRAAAVAAALALALTGCGSTALRGSRAGGGALTVSGTGDDGQQGQGGTGSSGLPALGTSSTGAVASTGSAGSSGATGGTGGAGSGSATGFSGSSTTGMKAGSSRVIRVGVTTANIAAIAAAFGKKPDDTSNDNPFIDYLNKHGGIAGRKIVPVYYQADSSQDASTSAQAACATFTQDNKVDVVVDGVIGGDVLPTCLQQKGIAEFTSANTSLDTVSLSSHPNMFNPSSMAIDRQMRALLQISAARKNLKAGAKLGVMVENCPAYVRTYNNVVVPMAKQLGVTVTQSSVKCVTNLVEDLGPLTNDVQRAALTFASNGVTHVMAISVAEAFVIGNFTTNASQQKYYPKYLVTTNAYPWGNSQSDATVKISPDALPNMTGMGYIPLLDVGTNARPNAAQKARQAMCTKADPTQIGAQSDTTTGKSFKQSVFFTNCETVYIMKAAVEASGLDFDYRALSKAYYALKQRGQVSADLNNGVIGGPASALDGVGYVQPFAYDTGRKTFDYVAPSVAVS